MVEDVEAVVGIKLAGFGVFFGDGEGEAAEVAAGKFCHAAVQQRASEAEAAEFRGDAELRDVTDVGAHSRAEKQALNEAAAFVTEHPRIGRVEDAAAGEADDVVQEAQRALDGGVLVVDLAVDVAEVGAVDEVAGSGIEIFVPGNEAEAGGQASLSASCTGRS